MEDQIASFKDRVHEKLIEYFKPSQEGDQQKSGLEDDTRLILFIYLCFNCFMFTMVSLKIFIYWIAVNVLVFVFLKYFLAQQRPEMTFDTQFGRQVRAQTFFEGGYNQEVKVSEVKPKSKPQSSEKNDKESYVLKESKSTVKKRSIYAMDLPAESNHLQAQVKEQSFRHSANESYVKAPREEPSFSEERDPIDNKKDTEPKTSLILKIRGSISNLKFRLARKNKQEGDHSKSTKKSFLSLFSFARFAKRKQGKESIQADDAPMEIEEEEIQEIPKNKEETTEIPKEKEQPKVQQETQEEIANKRNKISQDFQNQVIQELMKQMGGKNLSQLIAPKQQQQHDINQILNEMESTLSDKKGQDQSSTRNTNVYMSVNKSQTMTTTLVKEPIKIPQAFANSQRVNKGESTENNTKSLKQPSLKVVAEEQKTQKPVIQSQSTDKSIEESKSTRTKARLAYIDDDSEDENEPAPLTKENQNLNETPQAGCQASFTLNEQNANNESVPEQPQDSGYESVSFGKSRYFACVFADRPLREVEDEVKPENETDVKPENEISYGNNFGIQFPGNDGNQDWGQNVGGLNQASFFNNLGDYFKTESWNNNESQYEENQNQTSDPFINDHTQHFDNQEIRENPEENNSMYQTSYQNTTQNFNEEEENNSLLIVKPNKDKQVNNSFSGGGLANNQKKGFLGRRGLASGSSFGLPGKNAK